MTDHAAVSLPRLRLGPIELDFPVVQAALSGYSDRPMRVIARRLGAPYTLCEVMLEDFVVKLRDRKRTRRFLTIGDDEHPIGGQLMGADPELFSQAAVKLVQAGFDVIDINFGCPAKRAAGRCRGGFHLGQPDVALDIVARVREVVPPHIPVTVKMRRALDETSQSRDNFFTIFDGAFSLGVAAITVHGRTVAQRYDGPSNWDRLREIKQHAGSRTVFGSGDLFTAHDCLDMIARTGVDGVTAARGAIGNPWIFRQARQLAAGEQITEPTLAEQKAILAEHFRLVEEDHGLEQASGVMRKFGIYYSRLHPCADEVRKSFIAARTRDDWQHVLDRWYGDDAVAGNRAADATNPVAA